MDTIAPATMAPPVELRMLGVAPSGTFWSGQLATRSEKYAAALWVVYPKGGAALFNSARAASCRRSKTNC